MDIKIILGKDAVLPANANDSDTGYDVVAATEPTFVGEKLGDNYWKRIDYIEYDTNIQISPNKVDLRNSVNVNEIIYGYISALPRSSISKYNLLLANSSATIDNGYRGNIKLRFKYVWQPEDYRLIGDGTDNAPLLLGVPNLDKIYKKGDKIGQLIAKWKENINWEIVSSLEESKRGDGGFGSSGR